MAETIAVLSLKGGTGKTTTVRTLADVFRRVGLDVLAHRPRPAGQPVGLLRRPAGRVPDDRRRARGRRQGEGGDARRDRARDADPRRGRALAVRARWAASWCCARRSRTRASSTTSILIDCPPALGLLTVNGLVAADWALISSEAQYFALQGVQRRARGDRAGEGVLQPRPRVARRGDEHRRHAHRPLARGLRRAAASTSATRCSRPSSAPRSPTRSRPSRALSILDHRPGPRRRLPRAGRRGAQRGSGCATPAGRSKPLLAS